MRLTKVFRMLLCAAVLTALCAGCCAAESQVIDGGNSQVTDLKYANANDIASLVAKALPFVFGGRCKLTVADPKQLVVWGLFADEVDQVTAAIAKLDVEGETYVTPIRVEISQNVTVTKGAGKPVIYQNSTSNTGGEGTPIKVGFALNIPHTVMMQESPDRKTLVQRVQLQLSGSSVKVVPTVGTDGRIGLVGHGDVDFNLPSQDGFKKSYDIAVSAVSGKPAVVAAGKFDLGDAKVEFEVTLTATPQPGRVHVQQPGQAGVYGGHGSGTNRNVYERGWQDPTTLSEGGIGPRYSGRHFSVGDPNVALYDTLITRYRWLDNGRNF